MKEAMDEHCLAHEVQVALFAEHNTTHTIKNGEVQKSEDSLDISPSDEIDFYCQTCQLRYKNFYSDAPIWAQRLFTIAYKRQYGEDE